MIATDLLLLAVIAASMLLGYMRGLLTVLVSTLAWLCGGWAAFRLGAWIATSLAHTAEPGTGHLLAGYALGFLGALIFVDVVGRAVHKRLGLTRPTGMDRALGLGLGVVRGGLIACMLLLVLGLTPMPQDPTWQESQLVPLLLPGAKSMIGWLPDWARNRVDFGRDRRHPADGSASAGGGSTIAPSPSVMGLTRPRLGES